MVHLKSLLLTLAASVLMSSCSDKPKQAAPAAAAAGPVAPVMPAEQSAPALAKAESRVVPVGAALNIRILDAVDSELTGRGRFIPAVFDDDVMGSDGHLAIPAGTHAVVVVRDIGREGAISRATLGVFSIEIDGHSHRFSEGVKDAATLKLTEDAALGASHRSVHLEADSRLSFKVEAPLDLR
jgi:hypothetical protein